MMPKSCKTIKIFTWLCCCILSIVTTAYSANKPPAAAGSGHRNWNNVPGVTATTIAASVITTSSVSTGVTVSGVAPFTEKGIVYGASLNPTTTNTKITSPGTVNGTFPLTITGLAASSTFHVRAYVISSGNTFYGADISFTTLAPPVITVQPAGGAICGAGTINMSVTATGTGTKNYQWKNGGTNTGTNSNMLSATAAGNYTVVVTDNNGSVTSSVAMVTITAVPTAPLTRDTVICTGTAVTLTANGAGTIGWYDAASGGNYLGGGSAFTTDVLSASVTLYVQDSSCAASATRSVVHVTVNEPVTYYQDADGDGFGNAGVSTTSCSALPGYVTDNTDCDDAIATLNPAIFGDGVWNVFAYNGVTYESYYGYYVDTSVGFNTMNSWDQNGSPSSAAGYIGCVVPPDGHSYKAKRKGFKPGCYSISINFHDDFTTLYIDGVMVFQHIGCCDSHANVWSGELNANSEVEIDTQEGGGESNSWYVFSSAISGIISENQEVCPGATPADVTLAGSTGTLQWQSSVDNILYSDIPGATDSLLTGTTVGAVTSPVYLRAIASIGTCSDTSAVLSLSVSAIPVGAITGTTTGYDSVTLTASGGVSYLWSGGNSITNAVNTFEKSLGYTVQVFNAKGCYDTVSAVVNILRIALNRYGSAGTDSATHVNNNGAIGKSLSVDKHGKLRNAGINDGRTIGTAGGSAWQIKKDFPASADGLYWIKNANINGGAAFQIYADMTTDGGGWTLILCNTSPNPGWDASNALLRNENSPGTNNTYSIIGWANYIKKSATGFQYMIDAQTRGSYGGIWTANENYSFVNTDNTSTNITLNTKFGSWEYSDDGIEERMPWYAPGAEGIITTSNDPGGNWWGTLIARDAWSPAPWLGCCGMSDPGVIWYWVR